MNIGWVKLHRSLLDWEWYGDHNTTRLFVHLLMTVNFKESRHCGHVVPRGARVAGYQKLSEETGLSVQELRTASAKLKSTGNITGKSTGKFSIITVCDYEKYQTANEGEQQASQQASQQAINRQSTGTAPQMVDVTPANAPLRREECKNNKKEKKSVVVGENQAEQPDADAPNAYPRKRNSFRPPSLEEVMGYCNSRQSAVNPAGFFDYYTSNGWRVGKNPMKDWKAAVRTWERGEVKKTKTAMTGRQQYMHDLGNFLEMTDDGTPLGGSYKGSPRPMSARDALVIQNDQIARALNEDDRRRAAGIPPRDDDFLDF